MKIFHKLIEDQTNKGIKMVKIVGLKINTERNKDLAVIGFPNIRQMHYYLYIIDIDINLNK